MKYVIFNVLADGTPTTRFGRELVLAIRDAGQPIRVMQMGHFMVGGQIYTLSSHFLEPRYHCLIDLMSGPLVPGKEMYVLGDVKDVVQRILRRDDCAPRNYAFITMASWDDSPQKVALARGLLNYDQIYVFSDTDQKTLANMGVPSEVVGEPSEYVTIGEEGDAAELNQGRLAVAIPAGCGVSEAEVERTQSYLESCLPAGDCCFVVSLDKEVWNMSLARNVAIQRAYEEGFDYIAFHDVDIQAHPGYWGEVKHHLAKSADNVVVPKFVGEPSGIVGIASGNIAIGVKKALEIDGYDENYVGGGSEDIDFLFRLGRDTVSFQITPESPPLVHYDHEPRRDRNKYDVINDERVRRVMDYEDLDVQSILKDLARDD